MSYSDNHAVSGVLRGWVGVGWESFSVFCLLVHCPFHLPFCLVTLTHFLLLLISSLPFPPLLRSLFQHRPVQLPPTLPLTLPLTTSLYPLPSEQ